MSQIAGAWVEFRDLFSAAGHWTRFYARPNAAPSGGSAFAAWVSDRLAVPTRIVDMGCGNGRDSRLFAALGHRVLGIDKCPEAIGVAEVGGSSARWMASDLRGSEAAIAEHLGGDRNALLYARFFLHAIQAEDASRFVAVAARALPAEGLLALEYRTLADMALPKTHGEHFRRFVDHEDLLCSLEAAGFAIRHAQVGQGLAVYGDEDPVVGRILAQRRWG